VASRSAVPTPFLLADLGGIEPDWIRVRGVRCVLGRDDQHVVAGERRGREVDRSVLAGRMDAPHIVADRSGDAGSSMQSK